MAGERGYKYAAVPTGEPAAQSSNSSQGPLRCQRRQTLQKIAMVAALLLVGALLLASTYGLRNQRCEETASCTSTSPQSWGQYSPFFWAESSTSQEIPKQCGATFVQVLSRHGSRGPTTGKLLLYAATLARLQSRVTHYAKGFEFIKDYEIDLEPDQLTWYGEKEMVDSGEYLSQWYADLARDTEPFVRASGSERVIASAVNFTQGFYGAQDRNWADYAEDILVIPEKVGYNNTLDHGGCAYFEDGPGRALGVAKQHEWRDHWAPAIQARLNRKLQNADMSIDETIHIMELCPFITVASRDLEMSKFCSLFTESEWQDYDYYQSIEKWYVYGPGRELGPTQGVGFVNELIARLTGKAVDDHTSTNSTLDSSPATYPLDRKMYADFSHDNTMMAIYAAMGLYNTTANLPVDHRVPPQDLGGYSAAWAVPFGGRVYVEKMTCSDSEDDEELVRVVVNGRVMPLQGCGADALGRCRLSAFVESLSFARAGGRWSECEASIE